jgi:hypothetical protein
MLVSIHLLRCLSSRLCGPYHPEDCRTRTFCLDHVNGYDFLTTDVTMSPPQIVEGYTQRWSIETTFQECREYLKLESTKC